MAKNSSILPLFDILSYFLFFPSTLCRNFLYTQDTDKISLTKRAHQNVSILRHRCFVGLQDDTNYFNRMRRIPLLFIYCLSFIVFYYTYFIISLPLSLRSMIFFFFFLYYRYIRILFFVAIYFVNMESNYFYRRTFRNVSIGTAIFNFIVPIIIKTKITQRFLKMNELYLESHLANGQKIALAQF